MGGEGRSDSGGVKGVNGRVVECILYREGWVAGRDLLREGKVEGRVSEHE